MGRIHKESRFIECSKLNIKFTVYSEFEETDIPGEYRCIYTSCPVYSETRAGGYSSHRCNGQDRFGRPCPYAEPDDSIIYRSPAF